MVEITLNNNHAANAADLEGDIVIFHSPASSISERKKFTRLALIILIAILAAIAVGIAVGTGNEVMADPPVSRSSVQEATLVEEVGPTVVDAPKPAPAPAPKEEDNLMTNSPTWGGTVTVSTETSSPPTVSDREDRRSMVQSPTWRG
mmetsp:Transcript_21664/g.35735  ORF Transcript_21664/g.35735 Transcript_21664/m.35735 type:complete len:147 (-) Transcript_21664:157-597(-)